jgi:site-specific recombinase XerC
MISTGYRNPLHDGAPVLTSPSPLHALSNPVDRLSRSQLHQVDGAIRTTQIQALVTTMGIVLAPSTVRVKYSYLVSIMHAAVRDKVIASSPCEGVRLPEVRKKEVQIPSLAVLDALRETLPERFQAVVDLVAGSGLRQGEVFGLEVDGLDFLRTRSVDVHQQLITLANQAPYLDEPKSVESYRVVPLAQVTLNALAAHLALYPARTVTITDRTDPRSRSSVRHG